ncbi:MAG: hypothetical protein KAH54_03605 [Candidatus Sabulitectum sp.]|nr:hypothetical protein [Candidatus Sabulitectum sp.]
MAEKTTGLTTEQLLIELGKVVMGLGRKIESLGEKMDAIHSVLADDIAPSLKATEPGEAGEAVAFDMTPLLDKLDELKVILEKQTPAEGSAPSDMTPLLEKFDELKVILEKQTPVEGSASVDLTPVVEKIDAVTAAIGEAKVMEELKPILEGLLSSFEQLPLKMTDKLKELKDGDPSNSMEIVETKLAEACDKLEEILKVSKDRDYVETLSKGMTEVKDELASSGKKVQEIVKQVPDKIDKMGKDISGAMKAFSDTTGTMLKKTEKNITDSNKSLDKIKTELEKGLKLSTDMTSQMVDLTSKFADKVEEDKVFDLNTRAIGHFNRAEYPEAEICLNEALALSPENPELLCNTAHLKAAMEQMEESEKFFRKALEASPDLEPAISGLGMLMVKTGRAEETIEFLKNAIPDVDMSVRTVLALSRALAAVDKHSEAVELLETTLRGAPNHPDLTDELARYGHEDKS